MNSDLDFFKMISPRVSDEGKLQLPPGSRERMRDLSNKIILRDRYKNLWPVELVKDGENCYFDKGWMKLYNHNWIEPDDALVFTYKGDNLFDFKILGLNACEKEGVGGPNSVVRVEDLDSEKEEHTEMEDTFGTDESSDEDDNAEEETDESEDDDYVKEEEETDESDDQVMEVNVSKNAVRSKPKCYGRAVTKFGVRDMPPRRKYTKRNVLDCYSADIFLSGLVPRPKNPYFVSSSRPVSRPNELYIPTDVIKDYDLTIPEKFAIVDEKGNKWGAKVRQWSDGRLWCIRGWDSLCKANRVERDDTCICEFVGGQDHKKDFFIKVHVLRK